MVDTTRLPRAAPTMIEVMFDPDRPEVVVVCRFGHVKVLFGAVDEGVGPGRVTLCSCPQVNFGVVVRIVGVVALDFVVVFVGPTTVVFTL